MLDNSLEMSLLFDTYGELLTGKQKICFDLYFNQDLSLAEIAQEEGISRQGVHDSIARAEASLRAYEAVLGCVAKERAQQKAFDALLTCAEKLKLSQDETVRELAEEIARTVSSVKE